MQAEVPYHLLDILDPAQTYSAAQFVADSSKSLRNIHAQGKVALITGGTMLYIDALLRGISSLPAAQPDLRAQLTTQAQKDGWESLHRRLKEIDLPAAKRIHHNDSQRILRALEVAELTGRSLSSLQQQGRYHGLRSLYWREHKEILLFRLDFPDRSALHARIRKRFLDFINNGFVDEVSRLKARGDLSLEHNSMRAVGYRQIWEYLEGLFDYEEMVERGIAATRQLAKRQLTWLRNWSEPLHKLDARISEEKLLLEIRRRMEE